jgi:hypothetical protein
METEPCPRCGKEHTHSEYKPQPDRKLPWQKGMPSAPDDIKCDCGALLRHIVPFFKMTKSGWMWKIL